MFNHSELSDDSLGDTPVPMPNTEVKLLNVDDTWRVTAWESRKLPERKNAEDNDRSRYLWCLKKKLAKAKEIFLYSSVGRAHDC